MLGTQKPWTGQFHTRILQKIWEELTPIVLKLFQKIQKEGRLPKTFYEASIVLIPKLDEDTRKKTSGQYC